MTQRKIESEKQIKRVYSRYISIDENIHSALDGSSLLLYMAFRFFADFSLEDSVIKKSVQQLHEKAKISRRQFFISLNKLEDAGLIEREAANQYHSVSSYHVARELNYFNTQCVGVQEMHGVVQNLHTDHNLLSLKSLNNKKTELIEEIKEVYHEELPDLPKMIKLDDGLKSQLKKMINTWPSYNYEGKDFTIDSFRNYLKFIKNVHSWILKPYKTKEGNWKKNNLRVLTREINLTKFVNGEFSADN